MYEELLEINALSVILRISLALVCGGLVGLEREKNRRPAGLRTHIIVSIGGCMAALTGVFGSSVLGINMDASRIAAQVISGIGFLGVGTIFVKDHDHITGLTTAAGLWATGAIGVALGYGFYEGSIFGTFLIVIVTTIFNKFEHAKKERYSSKTFYLELEDPTYVNEVTKWVKDSFGTKEVYISAPRSGKAGNVGMDVRVPLDSVGKCLVGPDDFIKKEGVVFALDNYSNIGKN